MFVQASLWDTDMPISSPGSADGPTRSDLQDGLTNGPFGPDRALANLTPRQALERGMTTRGPYGGHGVGSSISAVLQLSLASRLRQKLDVNGSPEYGLTWKQWDMPSGPPICALRASARRTLGSDYSGWPTPLEDDANNVSRDSGAYQSLARTARTAQIAGWMTLRARVGGHADRWTKGDIHNLEDQARIAGWPTPNAMNGGQTSRGGDRKGELLIGGLIRGAMPSGSPVQTERRGALNPALSLWLMGYPDAWFSCGVRAMQSFQSSRRVS